MAIPYRHWLKKLRAPVPYWVVLLVGLLAIVPVVGGFISAPSNNGSSEEELGIQQLITSVKDELTKADRERQNKGELALFEVKDFDLEINFTVKKSKSLDGKLEYKVVTADSKVDVAQEKIQKITLHMATIQPAPVEIPPSDQNVTAPHTDRPRKIVKKQ